MEYFLVQTPIVSSRLALTRCDASGGGWTAAGGGRTASTDRVLKSQNRLPSRARRAVHLLPRYALPAACPWCGPPVPPEASTLMQPRHDRRHLPHHQHTPHHISLRRPYHSYSISTPQITHYNTSTQLCRHTIVPPSPPTQPQTFRRTSSRLLSPHPQPTFFHHHCIFMSSKILR